MTIKLVLGLMVIGLGAGASTATELLSKSSKVKAPVTFFNESGDPTSTDPMDYVYDSNGQCVSGGNACSASWEHTGPLTEGAHPDGSKLQNDEPGTYIPSN